MANQGISKSALKLVPSDPSATMVFRDITPNLTTLSTPFLRFGRLKIGGRGTIVKLQTGNLAVFSPVALTPEVKSKVTSMAGASGKMRYLIAPDFEHHIFIGPWAKEYPEAEVIGMEGLPEKREKDPETKGTKFHHVFSASNKHDMKISAEFDAEFDYEYVDVHQNKELVFVHKPTRTMIQADLLFNLPATEQFSRSGINPTSGILTKIFCAIMNLQGEMKWQKRLLWYGSGSSNRQAFADSMKRIDKFDFDRMIPCHGDVIETGAKGIFDKATDWFREMK